MAKYKIGDFIEVEELEESKLQENNEDIIIDSTKFKGQELKYYQNNLQGKTVKHPVLGEIYLGFKGRRETGFRSSQKYLTVICYIDKIIETGYSNGEPEELDHPRNKGTIHCFYSVYNEVLFDGKPLGITVLIAEDNKGKKYYMFRSYMTNENLMSEPTGVPQNEELYQLHQASNLIINDSMKNVKRNVTKVNEEYKMDFKELNKQLLEVMGEGDRVLSDYEKKNSEEVTLENLHNCYWNPEKNLYIDGEIIDGFDEQEVANAIKNGKKVYCW